MKCLEVQPKLLDFIDCQLSESDKQTVQEHLDVCKECNSQFLEWEETINAINESKEQVYNISVSNSSIKNNVMKRIELYEGHKKTFNRNIKIWNRLASIAAAFAIMFAGYAGYNHTSDPGELQSTSLAIEQHSIAESSEKKGDVVRIASNDETSALSNFSLKGAVPYSLGGIFLGIGATSIVMRRKLENQLKELLK